MLPDVCFFFLHEQSKTFMLSTTLHHLLFNIQSLVDVGGFTTNTTDFLRLFDNCLGQKSLDLERMPLKIYVKVKYKSKKRFWDTNKRGKNLKERSLVFIDSS